MSHFFGVAPRGVPRGVPLNPGVTTGLKEANPGVTTGLKEAILQLKEAILDVSDYMSDEHVLGTPGAPPCRATCPASEPAPRSGFFPGKKIKTVV